MYINTQLLCCILETNIILYVSYIWIGKKKEIYKESIVLRWKRKAIDWLMYRENHRYDNNSSDVKVKDRENKILLSVYLKTF